MKKCILIMLGLVFCFSGAYTYGSERKTGINIGLRGGMFFVDDVNSLNVLSVGGVVGYTLPFKSPYFEITLEGDFNLGIFGGDRVSGHLDDGSHIRTFGAYGVVSSIPSNDIYVKGKIGATHETEFETRFDYGEDTSVEKIYRSIGPVFGVGVGYNAANNAKVEAEFTTTHSEMKFFSLCLIFLF